MNDMNIVIDARNGIGTGIGRYTLNLLQQLEALDQTNTYTVLLLSEDFERWEPVSGNVTKVRSKYRPYGLAEQLLLPSQLRRLQPDLVHFTSFNTPITYRGKFVVTVHDFTLVDFRNTHRELLHRILYPLKYQFMRLVLRHSIEQAAHIMTPSEFVRADLLKRYGQVAPIKVTTTLEAVDSIAHVSPGTLPKEVKKPFLLYVGNSYPHKNLPRLIEAFGKLAETDLQLVLVGREDYFYRQLKHQTSDERIIFPGYASEAELAALYHGASLFVFPSLSEGFGLPPLEAMAYGTPVMSSNASCMPEICGDAAAYFNPLEADDMASKIDALLGDQKELERLQQAGFEQVKKYSWKTMAAQTLRSYQEALNK
jgi:glycosyltransferase involved in cell wall biosynthesis